MSSFPIVYVDRFARCPWGTYGRAAISGTDFESFSVEPPWKDNKLGESCIPAGEYHMRLDVYYGGDGVGGRNKDYPAYELDAVPGRSEIKIHILNAPSQSDGCIGLGDAPSWYRKQWSVSNSKRTYRKFMQAMQDAERALLVIRWRIQP